MNFKNYKSQVFVSLILILITISGFAAPPARLVLLTAPWEKYTDKDGTGLYFELIDKTLDLSRFEYKLMPWKRAQIEFKKNKGDILLAESKTNTDCYFPEWPIDADFFSYFYLQSTVSDKIEPQELNEKYKFIWVRGYGLHETAPQIKQFQEVDDMKQGIEMILKHRADVLIDYDEDLKDYIKTRKLDPTLHVVKSSPISGDYIYVCFKKNNEGKSLAKDFDLKMTQLFKNGELKKIYQKYNREKNYQKVISQK